MKKLIVYSMFSVVAIALVGCGSNSSTNAIKELNNQLDRVQNSISLVNSQDLSTYSVINKSPYSSTYSKSPMYTNSFNLLNLQNKVSNDITLQNDITQDLNNQIDNVKEMLKNSDTKYNKNQVKALSNLTDQLGIYATKLKNSKGDVSNSLKIIDHYSSINHASSDGLGSGYNSLSNTLEMRKAYYFNIANTLSQIEGIINNEIVNISDDNDNQEEQPNKNINIPEPTNENMNNNSNQTQTNPPPRIVYNYPPYNNAYNYGNYGNGYGYNGYYGYGYNRGFNPGRNTDTYRPWKINIDTYRFTRRPLNYGYNNGYNENLNNNAENGIMPINADAEQNENEQEKSPSQKLVEQNKDMLKNKRA